MGDRNLKLVKIKGIRIGDKLLTPKMLKKDAKRWEGKALLPGIGKGKFNLSDKDLLRQFCYDYMPFSLIAETPITLRAEVERFPYSINDDEAYQAFACRLVPESGEILRLEMHKGHHLAINSQDISSERVAMDLGNGSMFLEVYLKPQEPSTLQSLKPPTGFQKDYKTGP